MNEDRGKLILTHECDGTELVPKFLVKWVSDNKDIFHKFSFFDKGIEFYYGKKKKQSIFIPYNEIRIIYLISNKYFKPLLDYPKPFEWIVIETSESTFKTYFSHSLPMSKIKRILDDNQCNIGHKIFDNYGKYDYSIDKYIINDKDFEIQYLDGRKKNYNWMEVKRVSSITDTPFKIIFFKGTELSIHDSDIEFITLFRREYEKHIDRIEKDNIDNSE